ncbi:Lipopolysaccharide core heptosyltransferase RfaQ [Posidoniimonas polymericola]|uniref:Lipopolysaccharide core heptosyltransferase RfaQ n=1 Tax=Posidoniimonas polymericola TaxID=2528002 RepID=A0A5C5ZDF6_9BACT|nr:glycosyltransferase family 9 protein [Posidoniimonas polymericola]TWT85449.1 Lipopolysaccharide core heptosyltransferase RfaQ [Posidoniimonas polymericola]
MRVLLIRLSSLGDVMFTTPAITALAERYPGVKIDVATYQRFGAALQHHPLVDRRLLLPKKKISAAARGGAVREAARLASQFVRELRREHYDLIVDLHNVTDSALVALAARGDRRVGNARQPLSRLLHSRFKFDDRNETATEHAAVSNLRYLVEAGWLKPDSLRGEPRLSFHTPASAKENVDRFLQEQRLVGKELVGLNPGGSYEYKRWPAERFAEVGASLQARTGGPVLLFGGPAEREVVQRVAAGIKGPVVDTSALPLFEAFELISRLRLFVTNDSAPLHIATAAGTPTVGLYGPANVRKFYPLSPAARMVEVEVACRPCQPKQGRACVHRNCFSWLTTDQALRACDELLGEPQQRRAS